MSIESGLEAVEKTELLEQLYNIVEKFSAHSLASIEEIEQLCEKLNGKISNDEKFDFSLQHNEILNDHIFDGTIEIDSPLFSMIEPFPNLWSFDVKRKFSSELMPKMNKGDLWNFLTQYLNHYNETFSEHQKKQSLKKIEKIALSILEYETNDDQISMDIIDNYKSALFQLTQKHELPYLTECLMTIPKLFDYETRKAYFFKEIRKLTKKEQKFENNDSFALFEKLLDDAVLVVSPTDEIRHIVNRNLSPTTNHLDMLKSLGSCMGKILADEKNFWTHKFSEVLFKTIFNFKIEVEDIKTEDPDLFNTLDKLLRENVDDLDVDLRFSTVIERWGEITELDLIEDGKNVKVTDANKKEYVRLYCQANFIEPMQYQVKAIQAGFYEHVPNRLIRIFTDSEMSLLLYGYVNINGWGALESWNSRVNSAGLFQFENMNF